MKLNGIVHIHCKFLLGVVMAHLINESRGRQGVEECEQIEQAVEIKACYAKKKKDDTREHVRRCKA